MLFVGCWWSGGHLLRLESRDLGFRRPDALGGQAAVREFVAQKAEERVTLVVGAVPQVGEELHGSLFAAVDPHARDPVPRRSDVLGGETALAELLVQNADGLVIEVGAVPQEGELLGGREAAARDPQLFDLGLRRPDVLEGQLELREREANGADEIVVEGGAVAQDLEPLISLLPQSEHLKTSSVAGMKLFIIIHKYPKMSMYLSWT